MRQLLVVPGSILNRLSSYALAAAFVLLVLAPMRANAQGFQTAPTYSVGPSPSAVAVGDLNGDGFPDMVVANSGATNVSVLINAGNGTFLPAVTYSTLFAPSSVAVADLNGDGKLDIVVGTSSGVSVLLNAGNGTFPGAFGYSTALGQVAVGDFNGDGKPDIATSGGSVLLNIGNGNFQAGPNFSPNGISLVSADFNGDGKPDLAVVEGNCSGAIDILLGSGNGTFVLSHTYGFSASVMCPTGSIGTGDINGDGRVDIVASNFGGGISQDPQTGISILLGNGDGSFSPGGADPTFDDFSSGTTSVAIADFNNDGKQDVAVARAGTGVVVYLGNGDGTVQLPTIWGPPSMFVTVADVNRDGNRDLVIVDSGDNNVAVAPGNGDGTFQSQSSYYIGAISAMIVSIGVADFNGDGKQDLEVSSEVDFEGNPIVRTLLGNGNGTFEPLQPVVAGGFSLYNVATGDFNGDGKADFALASNEGSNAYLGNGDGTFEPQLIGDESAYFAVGDLNGDGKLDVVSADFQSSTTSVLLGNGDGTFQSPVAYTVSSPPNFVRLGDFNGDGKVDIAASVNGNVAILLGNGNGTFQSAVNYAVPNETDCGINCSLTAGDFNGDGKLDLVAGNSKGLYLLLGNGNGTFQSATLIGPPSQSVAALDFNGDGKLDLVSANGGLTLLSGNGDGTFQIYATYEAGGDLNTLKIGDFNGDGAIDVAVGTGGEAITTIFMNKGGTYITTTSSNSALSFDQSVTFTASVAASVNGSGTPSGTVSFFDSSTLLGSALIEAGEASIVVPSLSVGTHTIIAVYSGDAHFNPHTAASLSQRVQQAGTETSIVSSENPSIPGQAVTFTATVTSLTNGIPTGTVTFGNGSMVDGVVTLNAAGQASLTIGNLKPGSDYVGAAYNGNSDYVSSVSSTIVQLVTRQPSTTVLTSSANPITAGQSVTFTASVSSSVGLPKNGDTVTFKNGSTVLGTSTLTNGIGTFSTSSLPPGSDMNRATFPGDATLLASTSATLTETVNNFTSTTSLSSSVNPSTFGQNVTFTATVSAVSGGAPGGTVTFKNGAATLGTQNLTGGTAALSTNVLTVGAHSITAVYSGDASHGSSASPALSQIVNKASTSTSFASSLNPSTFGQIVTFTATIIPNGSGTPTGSVSFKSGTKSLGGVQLIGGVATFSTTTLAKGSDTITATYGGSVDFTGSAGTLVQVVN